MTEPRSVPVRLAPDTMALLRVVQADLQQWSDTDGTGDKVTQGGTIRHALRSYIERNNIPPPSFDPQSRKPRKE